MCTITYIPHSLGYIFTQNRDESPLRAKALFPIKKQLNTKELLFPKDPEGEGSWFVSEKNGTTIGIMNGAYHPDKKTGDYKHSRGLVPLHFFQYKNVEDFRNNYPFKGLEAFTLVVADQNNVTVLDWTEEELETHSFKAQPLIFQSKPLYPSPLKEKRELVFKEFIQQASFKILDFHSKPQTDNPETDILMDRKVVKTVSIIQRNYTQNQDIVSYAPVNSKIIFSKAKF